MSERQVVYSWVSGISYFVMDVDGTLTDGKVYIGVEGEVMKAFNIKDGYGIHDILPKPFIHLPITPIVITGRNSQIVLRRCKELGINKVYQGVSNKLETLKAAVGEDELKHVAFIGDDLNDMPCMKAVKEAGGKVGCPADAVKEVLNIADFIAPHKGGDGAVRDFIDWLNNYEEWHPVDLEKKYNPEKSNPEMPPIDESEFPPVPSTDDCEELPF